MQPLDEYLLSLQAYGVIAGGGLLAAAACSSLEPGLWRRLLPLPRTRRGWWSGYDVFVAFLYLLLVPYVVIEALAAVGFFDALFGPDPAPARMYLVSNPLTAALTLALIFALQYVRRGTRPHHYGLTASRWPANLVLGVLAFLVLTPVVLAVYLAVVAVLPGREDHVLQELVRGTFFPWEWGLLVLQAAVTAPVLEEIVFRGLLLGWLRRATPTGHALLVVFNTFVGAIPLMTFFIVAPETPGAPTLEVAIASTAFAASTSVAYWLWLRRLVTAYQDAHDGLVPWQYVPALPEPGVEPSPADLAELVRRPTASLDWQRSASWLAIYGSAMLFATSHSAWPSPIPLLLLAVGLGWLAQRTQSLVGPIVCHMLFNSVACLSLYWESLAR